MTAGRTGDGRPRTVRPGTSRADEPNVAIERRALPTPTVNVLGRRRLNMGGHPFAVGRFAPRARMKRQWQFSLASLLLTMLAVAVACAVFPYPRTAFYTLLALLCFAAVLARFGPTRHVRFGSGFRFVVGPTSYSECRCLKRWKGPRFGIRRVTGFRRKVLAQTIGLQSITSLFAHSLFAICVALTGAALAIFVRGHCGSLTIGNPPGGSTAHLEAKPEPSVATERSTAG